MSHRPGGWGGGRPRLRRSVAVLAVAVLGVTGLVAVASAAEPGAPVSKELLTELQAKGTTSFMVYRGSATTAATRGDRATKVYQALTGTADRSQRGLRVDLTARKVKYTPFWIANAVRVEGDQALVTAIAARPEVERIEPARTYRLITPQPAPPGDKANVTATEWA